MVRRLGSLFNMYLSELSHTKRIILTILILSILFSVVYLNLSSIVESLHSGISISVDIEIKN